MVKQRKQNITNTKKNVPGTGARSAPAPGRCSERRRAKRAGARDVFRAPAREARRPPEDVPSSGARSAPELKTASGSWGA